MKLGDISVIYAKGSTVARNEVAESYAVRIHNDIKEIRHGFIKLGFHLDEIKKCGYYKDLGYHDFYEFCEVNYRLDKSAVSRYMNVFYKFAEFDIFSNTRKMWIAEKYKDFSFSQLCEMLPVSDTKLLAKITPDMTIKEIRTIKKSGKDVATSQRSAGVYEHMKNQFYLTEDERSLVVQAVQCYIEYMEQGEQTHDIIVDELDLGLSSALDKLRTYKHHCKG